MKIIDRLLSYAIALAAKRDPLLKSFVELRLTRPRAKSMAICFMGDGLEYSTPADLGPNFERNWNPNAKKHRVMSFRDLAPADTDHMDVSTVDGLGIGFKPHADSHQGPFADDMGE